MEKFLRNEVVSPRRAAYAMTAAHNNNARVGGYAPCQWAFGKFTEELDNLPALSAMGETGHTMEQNLALRLRAEQSLQGDEGEG